MMQRLSNSFAALTARRNNQGSIRHDNTSISLTGKPKVASQAIPAQAPMESPQGPTPQANPKASTPRSTTPQASATQPSSLEPSQLPAATQQGIVARAEDSATPAKNPRGKSPGLSPPDPPAPPTPPQPNSVRFLQFYLCIQRSDNIVKHQCT